MTENRLPTPPARRWRLPLVAAPMLWMSGSVGADLPGSHARTV
jgi:hypothetical protein